VFCAAHAALSMDQRVAVLAAHSKRAMLLAGGFSASLDWNALQQAAFDFFLEGDHCAVGGAPQLAAGLARALCNINQVRQAAGRKFHARVLVVECSYAETDLSPQGLALVNIAFAAEAEDVLLDCLALGQEASALLRQIVGITGGRHNALPLKSVTEHGLAGVLLPALLFHFLPGVPVRRQLNVVAGIQNTAAVCACHGEMHDIAYVCSCCLSVYCSDSIAICLGCRSRFRPERCGPESRILDWADVEAAVH